MKPALTTAEVRAIWDRMRAGQPRCPQCGHAGEITHLTVPARQGVYTCAAGHRYRAGQVLPSAGDAR